jgi:recombination protein RecA
VGKTLVAIEACANFAISEPKGKIRYREAESAFDTSYAEALGFPAERVDFGDPIETIEDLFEDLNKVIKGAKGPEFYIVDSLDALSDRAELDRGIGEGSYGTGKAKQLSQLFRRLVREMGAKDVTLMIISQIRENINAMAFAKKWVRSGGRALDFYASQVCVLAQVGKVKKTVSKIERVTGTSVKAVIEKNKVALPYREAAFEILFGYGINDYKSCRDYLKLVEGELPSKDLSMEELHRLVEQSWYRIEESFHPVERKYDHGKKA